MDTPFVKQLRKRFPDAKRIGSAIEYPNVYEVVIDRGLRVGLYFIECLGCGKAVDCYPWDRQYRVPRFCGHACRGRADYRRKQRTTRTCEQCGESFEAKREDARFCGSRCRKRESRMIEDIHRRKRASRAATP